MFSLIIYITALLVWAIEYAVYASADELQLLKMQPVSRG